MPPRQLPIRPHSSHDNGGGSTVPSTGASKPQPLGVALRCQPSWPRSASISRAGDFGRRFDGRAVIQDCGDGSPDALFLPVSFFDLAIQLGIGQRTQQVAFPTLLPAGQTAPACRRPRRKPRPPRACTTTSAGTFCGTGRSGTLRQSTGYRGQRPSGRCGPNPPPQRRFEKTHRRRQRAHTALPPRWLRSAAGPLEPGPIFSAAYRAFRES